MGIDMDFYEILEGPHMVEIAVLLSLALAVLGITMVIIA